MNIKHTPRPWHYLAMNGRTGVEIGKLMIDLPEYDARLVSTAPELLALLQRAQLLVQRLLGNHQLATVAEEVQAEHLNDDISEAIAKATGGE